MKRFNPRRMTFLEYWSVSAYRMQQLEWALDLRSMKRRLRRSQRKLEEEVESLRLKVEQTKRVMYARSLFNKMDYDEPIK